MALIIVCVFRPSNKKYSNELLHMKNTVKPSRCTFYSRKMVTDGLLNLTLFIHVSLTITVYFILLKKPSLYKTICTFTLQSVVIHMASSHCNLSEQRKKKCFH